MNGAIGILRVVAMQLQDRARAEPKQECCGLLAGRDGMITQAFSATNAASHPATHYEIAAEDLLRLMREIRAAELQMLGIYHSHPHGENTPSSRDIERAYYPNAIYFIVSPLADAPEPVRAFSICEGRTTELKIRIT
jgi:proteasome lid subunit RPN8/RPN11